MPLIVAVVPPEWHTWGYNPPKNSARFARSNICTPLLKLWRRPTRRGAGEKGKESGRVVDSDAQLEQGRRFIYLFIIRFIHTLNHSQ